jgi:hypothetical protein
MGKLAKNAAIASLAAVTLCGTGQLLAQDCASVYPASVKGKISNNAQPGLGLPPSGLGFSTLGVVALNGGDAFGKMKCGIVSTLRAIPDPEDIYSTPSFIHTLSCDDNFALPDGSYMHSQLAFETDGKILGAEPLACVTGEILDQGLVYFTETSTPLPGPGNRGAFTFTTGGEISITGTINNCTGVIDMKFDGEIDLCMDPPAFD